MATRRQLATIPQTDSNTDFFKMIQLFESMKEKRKPNYNLVHSNGMYQMIWNKDGQFGTVGNGMQIFPAEVPQSEQNFALKITENHLENPLLTTK